MDLTLSVAAVIVAVLAWDFGRRAVAARQTYFADRQQIERLEEQVVSFTANIDRSLSDHKAQHEAAVKNLVEEMRADLGEMRTKVGIAAAKQPERGRKVMRLR